MAKIIAVANQKGGVGKTTTTVNLSACIAQQGKRVLCVDIDPQGNSTSGLGIDKEAVQYSVYDVLINGVDPKEAIEHSVVEGLDMLTARKELSGAEVELVNAMARETVLKRELDTLRDSYDYIFIDCPPSLGLLTINALTAADTLLAPIQCEYFALEGLSDLIADRDQFIAVSGGCKQLLNKSVSRQLEEKVNNRETVIAAKGDRNYVNIAEDIAVDYAWQLITPIICEGDIIGSVILLENDGKSKMGEVEQKLALSAAGFLGRQMEQ